MQRPEPQPLLYHGTSSIQPGDHNTNRSTLVNIDRSWISEPFHARYDVVNNLLGHSSTDIILAS